GKYALQSVEMMAKIAYIAEEFLEQHPDPDFGRLTLEALAGEQRRSIPAAISHVTSQIAEMLGAKLIVASTASGYTARRVARERPGVPILAATPNRVTYNRLALVWGVMPIMVEEFKTIDEMIRVAVDQAQALKLVEQDRS